MVEMKSISYLQAVTEAQREEMLANPDVVIMGEDLALYESDPSYLQGANNKQVWHTPISECGFTGMGVGAAMAGLRPIVNLTIASFVYLASDPIINQAGKLHYMTGGQIKIPAVFRAFYLHQGSNAAQHSDRPHPMFMAQPGLKIIAPSTPSDMKGLLKTAIRDDDPVLLFEDAVLWAKKGDVPDTDEHLIPLGVADIKRPGTDVTIVTISSCLYHGLKAAEKLEKEGISAEVIDPRTLAPLDFDTILESVAKTGRLVVVDNANRTLSAASEIAANVSENGFDSLKKPIQRVTTPDVHIPFSPALEEQFYPNADKIVAAVKRII
ncbi:MAG: transketolase C-terminal domain-containing protein [Pseudomonadota bacterium]